MDGRAQIERLIFSYAERFDAGDFAGIGELFAGGVIKVGGAVVAAGRYHDAFDCETGEWRFTQRDIIVELYGDLSRHLLIDIERNDSPRR